MATITAFDRINKLGNVSGAERRLTHEEYFRVMDISEPQKRKRIRLALELEEEILTLFAVYFIATERQIAVEKYEIERRYTDAVRAVLRENGIGDSVAQKYLLDVVPEEIRVTDERFTENPYWTSDDRAHTIAANDANILWNGQEFEDAIASGKTMKQWRTMKDERVRETHVAVDDEEIPIADYFVVGDSLMQYPGDPNGSPSETVNCRCALSFS